jgi:excisionase family DNA binding protein
MASSIGKDEAFCKEMYDYYANNKNFELQMETNKPFWKRLDFWITISGLSFIGILGWIKKSIIIGWIHKHNWKTVNDKGDSSDVEWLSLKGSAEYLKVSQSSIQKRVKDGKLTGYKNGRITRYKKSDLDKLFQQDRDE